MMDIALDEVIHFDGISSSSTGAAVDADSTPTFAVYEEATDTDIGVGGNMTKRTSLTGNYRGTFTLSAANGFEVGKWYVVIGSATVGGIATKGILKHFRVVLAESVVGEPKVDVGALGGVAQSLTDLKDFADDGYDPGTNKVQGLVLADAVTNLTNLPVITANWLTAAGTAVDFGTEMRTVLHGGDWAADMDSLGRHRIVDGTSAGDLDTLTGTVLLRAATQVSIDAIQTALGLAGAGLTDLGGFSTTAKAQIESEVNDALVALNLDHLIKIAVDTNFAATVHLDSVIGHLADAGTTATFDRTTDALEVLADASAPSAAVIADAVWDEILAGHLGAGSSGEALDAAGTAGDPWVTALPGAYGAGSAGFIIGTNINATISSRASQATLDTVDSIVDSILADTGTDGVVVNAAGLATDAVQEIRNAITGGAYALDTDANGRMRSVDGTTTGEIDTVSGRVQITDAQIDQIVDEMLDEDMTGHQTLGTLGKAIGDPTTFSSILQRLPMALSGDGYVLSSVMAFDNPAQSPVLPIAAGYTIDSATSTTFVPGSGFGFMYPISDVFRGALVEVYNGTGDFQTRTITGGDGSEFAIDRVWTTTPVNGDSIRIWPADNPALNASLKVIGVGTTDILTTYTGNTPQTGDVFAIANSGVHGNAALKTLLDSILDDTGTSGVVLNSTGLATDAVEEIRNAITGFAGSLNVDSGGNVKMSDGTGANQLSLTSGLIDGISGTIQTLDALDTAQDVEHDATQAAIAALNNLSAATILTQIETALNVTARAMPGQATPSATPTALAALMQLFQQATNPTDQNATTFKVYNRAGTVVDQKRTASDDLTTAALGALVTGP